MGYLDKLIARADGLMHDFICAAEQCVEKVKAAKGGQYDCREHGCEKAKMPVERPADIICVRPLRHIHDDLLNAIAELSEFVEIEHAASCGLAFTRFHPHPDDDAVDRFATALKDKLAAERLKGRGGWEDKAQVTRSTLTCMLMEHILKGDPLDVANFCMFLHERGETIDQDVVDPPQNL